MALEPVTAALDLGGKLIDRLWPDKAQADAAKLELFKLQQSGELATMTGQTEINKTEAASASLFVSGWRPFIGWICGVGLGYQFLLYPMLIGYLPKMQQLDLGTLITLLGGMLGLGGLRTVEKINGVASK